MALQELSLKEQQARAQRYNDVRSIKLDMLRRLQLRVISHRNVGDFFEREVEKPDVKRIIGEDNVLLFHDVLIDFQVNQADEHMTMAEWLNTLDIFTPLEIAIIKSGIRKYRSIGSGTIDKLVGYLEWSSHNNKEMYPLRHFTYLLSMAMQSDVDLLTFFEKISEDRFLSNISKHFYEDVRHGKLNDAISSLDAPDWYKEALQDGSDGGRIPEVTQAMVSYMEKTNQ